MIILIFFFFFFPNRFLTPEWMWFECVKCADKFSFKQKTLRSFPISFLRSQTEDRQTERKSTMTHCYRNLSTKIDAHILLHVRNTIYEMRACERMMQLRHSFRNSCTRVSIRFLPFFLSPSLFPFLPTFFVCVSSDEGEGGGVRERGRRGTREMRKRGKRRRRAGRGEMGGKWGERKGERGEKGRKRWRAKGRKK